MAEIRSKRQFFELWEAGVLGNRTRLWRDPELAREWAFKESNQRGKVMEIGFREIRVGAGAGKWEKVPWYFVLATANQWEREGRRYILDDTCPNELTTLCGEICRTFRGLEGTLAVEPWCGMRDAIKRGLLLPRSGATVLALLDRYMDPSSRDDLQDLLDLYPDAVVEFSCFTVDVGVLPNRNTIFWETRNY